MRAEITRCFRVPATPAWVVHVGLRRLWNDIQDMYPHLYVDVPGLDVILQSRRFSTARLSTSQSDLAVCPQTCATICTDVFQWEEPLATYHVSDLGHEADVGADPSPTAHVPAALSCHSAPSQRCSGCRLRSLPPERAPQLSPGLLDHLHFCSTTGVTEGHSS